MSEFKQLSNFEKAFFRPTVKIQLTSEEFRKFADLHSLGEKPKAYLCNGNHEIIAEIDLQEE